MSNCNECIICLENKDVLLNNNRCTCKYYYHEACWNKLEENKCILCNIKYNSDNFFVESPLIIKLNNIQTQPVEVRIQLGVQGQHLEQSRPMCACCLLSTFCIILVTIILSGLIFLK